MWRLGFVKRPYNGKTRRTAVGIETGCRFVWLFDGDGDFVGQRTFLNGKEFLCTDYEFMLAERKYEIEKEILDNVGIIDVGELRERVYHELETRDFLIGPSVEEVRLEPAYTW